MALVRGVQQPAPSELLGIYAAVVGAGRKARGARAVDLLIAATACSAGLPLYTRNPNDFQALHGLIEVVPV